MTDLGGTRESAPSPSISTLLTFLIADVRGYTRFTAEQGDEAAARLASRFAELCEEVVEAHEGEVIELRGDEALATFASARHALRAAVSLQQIFKQAVVDDSSLPLNVGMGLDAGEAITVKGGYRGGALNLAARLCSIAGPGEVFCSEGVIHLARKTEGIAFVDRGEATLKGLAAPVRVIQIAPDGELPAELPSLQPVLATHATNLPDEPTPFVGREREIDQVARLLRDPHIRLVTMTGPGGTGKTRLAVQVGNTVLHDFRDGAFFVNLAPLTDAVLVPSAIAEVLGVKEGPVKDLVEVLISVLREKQILLVLDNLEHLLDASSVIARLLDACRELHILVTSRISLHLSREHEYPVQPLSVPDPAHLPDPEKLSQYEAVDLFIKRAAAVKPGFAVTDENAQAVAEICCRLDGLPLAIELAAARIKLLPPQALLQRLSRRLKLLTGGARDRPGRQQTLRGAIDWSYSLLSSDEQLLFARFSAFAGGCTFEAAEAVCNPGGNLDLLEGLADLVDKNLIRQEGDEEPRFAMLETIREYATDTLQNRGEAEMILGAHASYFVGLAEEARASFEGAVSPNWLDRLAREHVNMRAALSRLLTQTEGDFALLLLAGGLWRFWWIRGHVREGRSWLDAILARTADSISVERAIALRAASHLAMEQKDLEPAKALADAAVDLARRVGDKATLGDVLMTQGLSAQAGGDFELARRSYEHSLALASELGREQRIGIILRELGQVARHQGDVVQATDLLRQSVALHQKVNDVRSLMRDYLALAELAEEQHDPDQAEVLFCQSLALGRNVQEMGTTAHLLDALAKLAARRAEYSRAAYLLAAAHGLRKTFDITLEPGEHTLREAFVAHVRSELGDTWEPSRRTGKAMSPDEAVAYALKEGP